MVPFDKVADDELLKTSPDAGGERRSTSAGYDSFMRKPVAPTVLAKAILTLSPVRH